MKTRHLTFLIFLALLTAMCSRKSDDLELVLVSRLDSYLLQYPRLEQDILIACAASEQSSNTGFGISVYFYPFPGAHDIKYFESISRDIDPMDFTKFTEKHKTVQPVFNAYLQRYILHRNEPEKWIVLTFLTVGKIHVSDPILLKHESRPTLYNSELIEINQQTAGHPIFSWEADTDNETVIYFEVLSDASENLISGTYTYEKHWQFYETGNVVLNITQTIPDDLIGGNTYSLTLMGVSEDNWVNLIAVKTFNAN